MCLVGRGLSEWCDWLPEALYKQATRPHAPLLPLGGNAGAATYLRHPRKLIFHRACVGGLRVWRELERANRAIRNGHPRFSRNVTYSGRFGKIFQHTILFATDRQVPQDRQSRPDTPEPWASRQDGIRRTPVWSGCCPRDPRRASRSAPRRRSECTSPR